MAAPRAGAERGGWAGKRPLQSTGRSAAHCAPLPVRMEPTALAPWATGGTSRPPLIPTAPTRVPISSRPGLPTATTPRPRAANPEQPRGLTLRKDGRCLGGNPMAGGAVRAGCQGRCGWEIALVPAVDVLKRVDQRRRWLRPHEIGGRKWSITRQGALQHEVHRPAEERLRAVGGQPPASRRSITIASSFATTASTIVRPRARVRLDHASVLDAVVGRASAPSPAPARSPGAGAGSVQRLAHWDWRSR